MLCFMEEGAENILINTPDISTQSERMSSYIIRQNPMDMLCDRQDKTSSKLDNTLKCAC